MKASVFIKTALIDQMQQIADLGLWFHLAKLIPSGVDVLARVWYNGKSAFMQDGLIFLPESIERFIARFYSDVFPGNYHQFPTSTNFFSVAGGVWLTSEPEYAEKHLQFVPCRVVTSVPLPQEIYIHVPQWFDDFKTACRMVLDEIAAGNLEDIEVLKMLEENGGDK